ncbi:Prp19/Pso4-like-domain-containing protein [Lipomyces tetrasporus]|uniref:Pre-mRNA-processing factor 19 n=1 Tax=Lipomyces tetrasporus TaxID=54092 RepID=A0AAD7QUR2_9ASCO|nr:Prp19/Pso4-like-domain-containing protein [Lipomyces tetrasporus]KAJ8101346.1 Prp19/Pso4-like-domain-containing protein [Lipomyces tetrasporus]
MLCALTGKPVANPVISKKSGGLFEKSAIEEYIFQHSQDPLNGEQLSEDDLIEVQNPRIVPSKPNMGDSVPSLLHVFQNEYDSLTLESFELKKQLLEARKDLSSTLYYHDAAVKVATRMMKERDEARAAIKQLSNGTGGQGEGMEVDK